MKVFIEEIVKAHPAGKNPDGYARIGVGSFDIDGSLVKSTEPDETLWLSGHGKTRRKVRVVCRRIVCSESASEVGVVVDVAVDDIAKEIKGWLKSQGYSNEISFSYASWAVSHKVWP